MLRFELANLSLVVALNLVDSVLNPFFAFFLHPNGFRLLIMFELFYGALLRGVAFSELNKLRMHILVFSLQNLILPHKLLILVFFVVCDRQQICLGLGVPLEGLCGTFVPSAGDCVRLLLRQHFLELVPESQTFTAIGISLDDKLVYLGHFYRAFYLFDLDIAFVKLATLLPNRPFVTVN